MNNIKDRIKFFKELPQQKKKRLYIRLALLLLPSGYLGNAFSRGGSKRGLIAGILFGLFSKKVRIITLIIYLMLRLILLFVISTKKITNPISNVDHRGVKFLQYGTTGSANWMTKEEAKKVYDVGDIKDIKETIFGQFTENGGGKDVVAFKAGEAGGNRNIFGLGSPGSGKSFSIVRTQLIQAVIRGESVVVTDPSGELFNSTSQFSKNSGAELLVFNLVNPKYSDSWDCLSECIDPETGKINALRLQEFCDIFMRNSGAGNSGKNSDFWGDSALNLLAALIGYVAWKHETELIKAYEKIFDDVFTLLNMDKVSARAYLGDTSYENVNFIELKKKFREFAVVAGYTEDEITAILNSCEQYTSQFTIGAVYQTLLNMGNMSNVRKNFGVLPYGHPGAISFSTFDREGVRESVKASAQQGLLLRLKLFMDKDIRKITSNKGINFEEFGRKQTVCYVITPDNNAAMKPLQALFFSFLFKDLSEAYDKRQAECEQQRIENERLGVNLILDEVKSNGIIANFADYLATVRKRKIYIAMFWQTIGQAIELYGENMADTIKSCCDILLFLGTADLPTAKYVSIFSGTATVQTQSYKETATGLLRTGTPMSDVTVSETERPVISVSEALGVLDDVIVIRRGYQNVLKLKRFGYIEHPAYKNNLLIPTSIFNYKPKTIGYEVEDLLVNTIRLADVEMLFAGQPTKYNISTFLAKQIPLPQYYSEKKENVGQEVGWDISSYTFVEDKENISSPDEALLANKKEEIQMEQLEAGISRNDGNEPVHITHFGSQRKRKKERTEKIGGNYESVRKQKSNQ